MIGEDGRMTAAAGERFAGMTALEAREAVVAALRAEGRIARTEPLRPQRAVLAALGRADRAADLAAVVHAHGRAGRSRRSRSCATGACRSIPRARRGATSSGWRTSAPGASRASSGGATRSPSGTAASETYVGIEPPRGRRLGARPRRARHVVLERAVAVRDARLARPDRRAARLLPDRRALDGARHPLPLGRADGDDGPRVHRRRSRSRASTCTRSSRRPTAAGCRSRSAPGIDPLDLIEGGPRPPVFEEGGEFPAYGADAVRFGLLAMSSTQDVRFNEEKIAQGRQLANKLWNAARLVLLRVPEDATLPEPAPAAADGRGRAGSSPGCRPPRPTSRARSTRSSSTTPRSGSTTSSTASCATGTWRWSSRACTTDDNARVGGVRPARAGRDAGARAPDDPVRDRGDLVAHARRGRPADGAPLPERPTTRCATRRPRTRSRARSPRCRSCAAGATASARTPGTVVPARLEAPGYERTAAHVARLARVEWSADGGEPVATVGDPRRQRSPCSRPRPSTSRPSAPRRASAGSEARGRRSRAPRASSRTRASWRRRPAAVVQAERDKLARLERSSRSSGDRRGASRDAEAHLLSLELFGMRFGLERMRRLLTALGSPQERFAAIHVVGTNGKSSTVRMCAALLEAHGVRTGAFLSPHLTSFAERIRIGDADLDARRVRRRRPAGRRGGGEGRPHARARRPRHAVRARHRRGVRRAGAPRASRSRSSRPASAGATTPPTCSRAPVCVLTNVGLEHTRWLGPDRGRHRAREARRRPAADATLVTGAARRPRSSELARATGARIVVAEPLDVAAARLPAHELRGRRGRRAAQLGDAGPADRSPRSRRACGCRGGCRWWPTRR